MDTEKRRVLKEQVKSMLKGNWKTAMLLCLSLYVILFLNYLFNISVRSSISSSNDISFGMLFNGHTLLSIFTSAITTFAVVAVSYGFLDWIRTKQAPSEPLVETIQTFTKKYFVSTLVLFIIQGIFIILWYLLLIIPGIIKAYAYSQTYFVYKTKVDNGETDISFLDCITKSRELMNGHKWDFFVLEISFVGWFLLSIVTLGIGFIWLIPYYYGVRANFYYSLFEDPQKA